MTPFSTNLPLSSLNPVTIKYGSAKNSTARGEDFANQFNFFKNGIRVNQYNLLENVKDICISRQNVLVLTSIKDLNDVFDKTNTNLQLTTLLGNCLLKSNNDEYLAGDVIIKKYKNQLYVGGVGETAYISFLPTSDSLLELKIGTQYLECDLNYPFDIRLVDERILSKPNVTYKFRLQYYSNDSTISFEVNTNAGKRFVSYNHVDRKLKALGVEFGMSAVNRYKFDVEFITATDISYGYDASVKEVKYFNSINSGESRKNLSLSNSKTANTNLLISLTLNDMLSSNASANVATIKTNYSVNGTYNSSI
jgi:hypothetical protein